MAINRDLWSGEYSRVSFPKFICPECKRGQLIYDPSSLAVQEPTFSKKNVNHPDWDPTWDIERFSLRLVCDGSTCGEIVHVIGDTSTSEYYDEDSDDVGMITLLRPQGMFPAPPIISLPAQTFPDVKKEIHNAERLYWIDLGSSANRLRVSVELLLDNLGVADTTLDRKGKTVKLDLNGRITIFEKSSKEHGPTLTALRMIGNLGSHGGEVKREALLDAFEIYEDALDELVGQRKVRMDKIRQKLISNKGQY